MLGLNATVHAGVQKRWGQATGNYEDQHHAGYRHDDGGRVHECDERRDQQGRDDENEPPFVSVEDLA